MPSAQPASLRVIVALAVWASFAGSVAAQEATSPIEPAVETIPEAPRELTSTLEPGAEARVLADPFGIELRTRQLEALLAADARSAEQSRTFGAVMGFVIGGLGLGATPVFLALDDGSGLLAILSILPLQLGALSLATAILGSVSASTEERRYADWQRLTSRTRPSLSELGRYEGFVIADADRARDARFFSMAQGIAGVATGLFTGLVGLFASRVEVTQITLGALGAAEILLGMLQLLGALEPGEVERRPGQYESRTGVQLSVRGSSLVGSF